jgi:hypothetical protein
MNGYPIFLGLTFIYAVLRFKITERKLSMIVSSLYILVLFVSFYFINLAITKEKCGSVQAGTALIVTAIPWLFVFIVMVLLLSIFPGWLSPFSNTFGYLFAKLAGLKSVMNKIVAPKMNVTADNKSAVSALSQIYGDQSLLINQITTENFEGFWEKMTSAHLFTDNAGDYKNALYNLVRLKTVTAEALWAFLTGGVAIAISNSFIAGTACKQSAKEMMEKHNQYESETANNETKQQRIYTV